MFKMNYLSVLNCFDYFKVKHTFIFYILRECYADCAAHSLNKVPEMVSLDVHYMPDDSFTMFHDMPPY